MQVPNFEKYYEGWARKENEYLRTIREKLKETAESGEVPDQAAFKEMVDRVINHVREYSDAKVTAATNETTYVAGGLWRTPLEGQLAEPSSAGTAAWAGATIRRWCPFPSQELHRGDNDFSFGNTQLKSLLAGCLFGCHQNWLCAD